MNDEELEDIAGLLHDVRSDVSLTKEEIENKPEKEHVLDFMIHLKAAIDDIDDWLYENYYEFEREED